jgi:hypothetical protein
MGHWNGGRIGKLVLALAFFGLIWPGSGCYRDPTELEDVIDYYRENFEWRMFVFSIISPQDTTLSVIAEATTYHSMPDTFKDFYYMQEGQRSYWTIFDLISLEYGADVYLGGDGETHKLVRRDRSTRSQWGAYTVDQEDVGVNYGGKHDLKVVYRPQGFGLQPDSIIISGSTTVPGDFSITSHSQDETIGYQDVMEVSWTPSEGARGYIVYVFNRNRDSDRTWESSTSDTRISVPLVFSRTPNPALFNDPAAGKYRIVIWAVDDGLYDFYNSRPTEPFQELRNHLDYVDIRHTPDGERQVREITALGVFGSRVMRQVDIELIPD